MKTYLVPITVTQAGSVAVKAKTVQQARELIENNYNDEDVQWTMMNYLLECLTNIKMNVQ